MTAITFRLIYLIFYPILFSKVLLFLPDVPSFDRADCLNLCALLRQLGNFGNMPKEG